ncbi:MAG TPA: hypothetical protein DCS43_14975 [Verrucomicrobia bacterium]|nr:hypothetical protein [Verrucomicrobiota bacterium]
MADHKINEVTPDLLMEQFQGKGLKYIIVFTLVVHAVVISASSVPYLMTTVFGADKASMTKEEQVKAAVEEATESIREIAAGYGLTPQDISGKFAGGGTRAAAATAGTEAETPEAETPGTETPAAGAPKSVAPAAGAPKTVTPVAGTPAAPARPKSAIEKELDVKAEGPAVPKVDDDIF